MLRFFLLTLLLLFSIVLQTTMVPAVGLAGVLSLPAVAIASLALSRQRQALIWAALVAGFAADLSSPLPFGLHTVSLVVVAIVTEALFLNFFTNRSIYAMLVLVEAASFLDVLVWFGASKILALLHFITYNPSWDLLHPWVSLGNGLLSIVLLYIFLGLRILFGRYFVTRRRSAGGLA